MYRINELAELAGVSARALRHYEELGLLKPQRDAQNGYRVYTADDVDRLQQVLFYRELGMPLEEIGRLTRAGEYQAGEALRTHLEGLKARRARLDTLIHTVEKTILHRQGEIDMADREKFEGFKKRLVEDNELRWGKEARARYGEQAVEDSKARVLGMSEAQHARLVELEGEIAGLLQAGVKSGDAKGETGRRLCMAHKEWLMFFWKEYNAQAHLALGQMYVDDPRFKAHYEAIAPGGAAFLRDALAAHLLDEEK